jgi:hypothetical protein
LRRWTALCAGAAGSKARARRLAATRRHAIGRS